MKLLGKLRHKIIEIYRRFFMIIHYVRKKKKLKSFDSLIYNRILEKFQEFCDSNADISYCVCKDIIPTSMEKHKWVGAQLLDDKIVLIPSDETKVIAKKRKWEIIGTVRDGLFKWTGGCVWNNVVYCFPRVADSFLKIDLNGVSEILLEVKYGFQHHYSGVSTADGVVYQPPRNTSHLLKTDLKTGRSKKIEIINEKFHIKLSYCGGLRHPNGYIYFFPVENCKVIKLNPENDEWCYIGNRITTYCFDAKVGYDGNIYGFNHLNGIMKINVYDDTVEVIHKNIPSFAYGTKLGVNGKLYSIPGDARYAYEYDIKNDKVKEIYDTNSLKDAKYAGGLTDKQGIIYGVPAENSDVIKYIPSREVCILDDLYESFFVDNY